MQTCEELAEDWSLGQKSASDSDGCQTAGVSIIIGNMPLRCLLPLVLLLLSLGGTPSQAGEQGFADWLEVLRSEARSLGISEATLTSLQGIEPLQRVLDLDRSQPEFLQTFTRYLGLRVTPGQINRGRELLQQHAVLLNQVRQRYGVQPHYLVAFWAIESNYGSNTGGFRVLQALATLAFDPRRADFFRRELLTALRIIDEGHISPAAMSGSWAGAMGQLQFLPTVYDRYGVDGDGDGRIDIWNSLSDVFHSAANFLSRSGWRGDQRWGREVMLPVGFDFSQTGIGTRRSLQHWRDSGITTIEGAPIPLAADMEASVVLPAGADGPAFLVYANFRATMAYNPSTFYALTVGHLADRYTGLPPVRYLPENEQAMTVAQVQELQELLNRHGFDCGEPDGRVGRRTRSAIRSYQQSQGLPMDGYASLDLLLALRR